ncbi:MAG TPA: universal stress protein [Flavobacteriales bacterium]|jgi:nucleotide-binding universal stress UspA family protein
MKTIIAATDFTDESLNAVHYAAQLSADTSNKLMLLHTAQFSIIDHSLLERKKAVQRALEDGAKDMVVLEGMLKKKHPDLEIDTTVREGVTLDILNELVEKHDVSAVVLSIRSSDTLYQALFESTSVKVAGKVKAPVLIVPATAKHEPIKKIVFAFDQKPIPMYTGIGFLKELKHYYHAAFQYVNVLDSEFPKEDKSSLHSILELLDEKEPDIRFLPSHKLNITDELTQHTQREHAQLLVMTSRKNKLFKKIFRQSQTRDIAYKSSIPLLVLAEELHN